MTDSVHNEIDNTKEAPKLTEQIRIPKRKTRIANELSRHFVPERIVSKNLIGDFDVDKSEGKALIEDLFGTTLNNISLTALVSLSKILSQLINIKLERNIYRRKVLIVKWFDINQDEIKNNRDYFRLIPE